MNKLVFRDKLFELQQCPIDINYRVKLVRELLDEYELLKERATPKKIKRVIVNSYLTLSKCPSCEHSVNYNRQKHCHNCGQELLWDNQQGSDE